MADKLERIYTIPLRKVWLRVPHYERTGKSVKEIKKFIAKHMKVQDRDVSKVKLDIYFNNELWFRGRANPPAKIKVKAIKEGDIVKVEFVEVPKHVEFLKSKVDRMHKKAEQKQTQAPSPEVKKEEKTQEEKKDEVEKEKSVEMQTIKDTEQKVKAQKHTSKVDSKKTQPTRMSLKK